MSDQEHDHEHEHDGACCHGAGGEAGPPPRDPAAASLAAALRTSFVLLGVAMVAAVLAFLQTGLVSVAPGQTAIRTMFGRVVGTTRSGLAINLPRPIGRIDLVPVGERTVQVGDFWMFEKPEDRLKSLDKREVPRGGLRPGWDGALLTGDRNLLHVRLDCTYRIGRSGSSLEADEPVLLYWRNVPRSPDGAMPDPNELMRSALATAALRAAATRTADALQREPKGLEQAVLRLAQERLDELAAGIVLRTVKVVASTWPLRTRADYLQATAASSEAEKLRNTAVGEARRRLEAAAGPAYVKLVGSGDDVIAGRGGAGGGEPNADYDLIGRYDAAVRRGDAPAAATLLERIDNVLVSGSTVGEASRIIAEAQGYRTAAVEVVKQRVRRFQELLPAYEKAPDFVTRRLWAEAREEILSSPQAEKHYIPPGDGKTVLRIDRDPEIVRQIRRAMLEKPKDSATDEPKP